MNIRRLVGTIAATVAAAGLFAASARAEVAQPGLKVTANDTKVGGTLTVSAALDGGVTPTGTLTISGYHSDCGGTPDFTQTLTVSGNGSYAATFTADHTGHLNWNASYSGDAGNAPASVTCAARSEIGQATPAITQSPTDAGIGEPISNVAKLTGGGTATGTIRFIASTNPGCEGGAVYTTTVDVSGDGDYGVSFTPDAMGRYYWYAQYSGDDNNAATGTYCDKFSTVGKANPSLEISATDALLGGEIDATATMTGGYRPTGDTVYRAWTTADCSGDPVFQGTTGAFTPAAAGSYHWIASYAGDDNNAAVATTCDEAVSTVTAPTILPAPSPQPPASALPLVSPTVTLPALTLTGVSGPRCIDQGASASVKFTVNTAAKVSFTLQKRIKPVPLTRTLCPGPLPGINPSATYKKLSALGGLNAAKGKHTFALSTRKLAPGRYRVVIAASANGKVTASFSFWVLKRRG
jgi:hypothetical protein